VTGKPESVDRAVVDEWVEMIDPILARIRLALRRERRRQQGEEDDA
jgi:hypothetical protein